MILDKTKKYEFAGAVSGYFWATRKAEDEFFEKYMYCPTCNACGESGCCEPSQCKRFVCIHGSEYLNEHEMEWQLLADAEAALIERNASLDDKNAEIERLKDLCKESLRCMQDAKRKFAPTTTNSDADDHIARLAAYLKEKQS